MNLLAPIIAVMILVGTLSVGSYVKEQAMDVVLRYNLSQISKVLDISLVSDGKYPATFDELIASGDLKNVIEDYKYIYLTSEDRQSGAVLAATDKSMWCWQSKDEEIRPLSDPSLCKP